MSAYKSSTLLAIITDIEARGEDHDPIQFHDIGDRGMSEIDSEIFSHVYCKLIENYDIAAAVNEYGVWDNINKSVNM